MGLEKDVYEEDVYDWSGTRQINASQLFRYLRGPAPRETRLNDMSFLRVALR